MLAVPASCIKYAIEKPLYREKNELNEILPKSVDVLQKKQMMLYREVPQ